MLMNKDRTNKGNVKGANEGHIKRKSEPGARELRRKNMVKKVKSVVAPVIEGGPVENET
jgi:hypothetical protein